MGVGFTKLAPWLRVLAAPSRGPEFDSQNLESFIKCLYLQIQGTWCPLLAAVGTCTHAYVQTHTHNEKQ